MKKHPLILALMISFLLSSFSASAKSTLIEQANSSSFEAGENTFLLNGKPFIIRAAELHYSRIPKPYWEHRIQLCKAMGMNTICIYLFWNYHEMEQGKFDFSGQKEIAAFVKLVQKNGMYCIVRPGPYVCAEWEMGGLPWWLLKKNDLKVRTRNDAFFMERTRLFLKEAGKQLAPLQIQNGGSIIMVQVENEYGVWGNDSIYMQTIRDYIREAGFDKVQLFRCDWSSNFFRYHVNGVASTLNFGAGSNIDNQFAKFKEKNPKAPLMCSEYWTGWFDHWGKPHETRSVSSFISSLKEMMERRISFSLYMAHGGTSFAQWAGANGAPYAPITSSYDYNAPIDEAGNTTEKFFAVRDLLKNYLQEGEVLGEIPANPEKTIVVPEILFSQYAAISENLPQPKVSEQIHPMEYYDQGWGSILYRTTLLPSSVSTTLFINEVHDWATVTLDGKLIGKLDRRRGDKQLILPAHSKNARLDILVEGMGRVNYGEAILDRKGITQQVTLKTGDAEQELKGWKIYNFPVDYASQKLPKYQPKRANGAGWYKATFRLNETGYTYLDMSSWGKGMVWLNGNNLGRFWKIGPTQTLCVPGCYLKKGENELIVFDVDGPKNAATRGVKEPILDKLSQDESLLHRKGAEKLYLENSTPVVAGTLPNQTSWQSIQFDGVKSGRYFCFEALSAQEANDPVTSLAEMELIGTDDKPISALNWRVIYADSEEVTKANNSATNIFDQQESIIWQTQVTGRKDKLPHQVVVDLGAVVSAKGFRVLPRTDKSKVGMVKDFRFYLQKESFVIK